MPRGLENDVRELLEDNGVEIIIGDETNDGRGIDVKFNGELRGEQQQAAEALLAYDDGMALISVAD